MFDAKPVDKAGHEIWIDKTLKNDLIAFYIVSFDGDEIGTVRFDFSDDYQKAEVGIYLAPEHQGRGLGAKMLLIGEEKAQKEFPTLKQIIARVVPDNIASEKMFIKSGYDKKFIQLEKKYE